jgi:Fur family zinc uptake transcriptional regulator
MEKSVFPGPDHDHGRCTVGGMALAEELCHRTGQRLTPMRRQVLAVLLDGHKPMGAYDIIGAIGTTQEPPAPITIYRALDFLRENGLVHRIESRNAFIACVHNHASGDPVVFLICEKCGAVGEAAAAAVADTIRTASRAAGFTPKTPVIEISGICAHCKAA